MYICISIYLYTPVYISLYVYIYKERERGNSPSLICMHLVCRCELLGTCSFAMFVILYTRHRLLLEGGADYDGEARCADNQRMQMCCADVLQVLCVP